VVVDDATRDVRLGDDPHVRRARPRSLLVAPLAHGRERLGALYLENNLATGVFTADRAETLHLLAVQAAIAIDRALLFGRVDEARRAAEAASVAKTRFLANMSHELRTPLNAILGFCELIGEEAEALGAGEIMSDVEKIQRAGAHLLDLVRGILDLTKLESDEVTIAREPIDVAALLEAVAGSVQGEIDRRGNRLVRAWDGEVGQIVGDAALLRQAIAQLLDNAAKFTREGEVVLRAERLASGGVRVAVADSGIGMTPDELALAFEPFAQADSSPTRRHGGAGLGLTICRKIVEALGGTLAVASEPGRGSTFTVELPAKTPGAWMSAD
jgi:signal transduction histidine kinase